MAYNGSGVYSLPPGSTIANGDTSDATDLNTPLADLETAQNTARPVVAGGTGAATASGARTNLGLVIGTDVQAHDDGLDDVAGLTPTDGNIIVGDGTNWVAESGATARTSLGLGGLSTITVTDLTRTSIGTGTSYTISSLPSGATRLELLIERISSDGTASVNLRLSESATVKTTGYSSVSGGVSSTTSFLLTLGSASTSYSGIIVLAKEPASDRWFLEGSINGVSTSGDVNLGGTLDALEFSLPSGNFDAGHISGRVWS